MPNENKQSFDEVKTRLDEIVDAVADESISLDDALDLYEEAIKLGMQVSSLLEEDIAAEQISEAIESLDPLNHQEEEGELAENDADMAGNDTLEDATVKEDGSESVVQGG